MDQTKMTIFDRLKRPFPPNRIHWRVGHTNQDKSQGVALAYIDARDVMQRLDEIVGPAGWSDRYHEEPSGRLMCVLSLLIDGEWVAKSDGAGSSKVEAEKGGISDAFKRTAVKWGIGRYLYSLESPWVQLERGRLPKNFNPPLPKWATPEGFDELMEKKREQAV